MGDFNLYENQKYQNDYSQQSYYEALDETYKQTELYQQQNQLRVGFFQFRITLLPIFNSVIRAF